MKKYTLSVFLAAATVASVQALSITPSTVPQWSGNETANQNASDIQNVTGVSPLTEVYKQDVGAGNDTGSFAGSYNTTFSNTPSDPSGALIHYTGGSFITGNNIYLFVKDGNSEPAWYLFDITAWNGTEDLSLSGFWPEQGAISHVTIYSGGPERITTVPDAGATLSLLGFSAGLLGFLRRKIS